MANSRTVAGDSHNFGRHVSLSARRVAKPRTLLWEWLVLSADSPLRRFLDQAAQRDGLGRDAFGFLPTLRFFPGRARGSGARGSSGTSSGRPRSTGSPRGSGGEVERIDLGRLPTLSTVERRALAAIVGRATALFSWLGVADLHWENLVLGVDRRGRMVFGPLDIEMILADFAGPTETKLLPDADPEYAAMNRHACGVRRVLPHLGKPVAAADLLEMAAAYRATLGFLDRHARTLAELFARVPGLRDAPIRVCLRATGDYVRARSEPVWPPLLDAEAEQLARGDIPYFFRLYGRPGIRYYGNQALTEIATIPLRGDVPHLDPLLQLSRGFRSPSRKKLRDEGLFTLLGAFDHALLTGSHEHADLEVTFGARALVVKLPSGEELRSRRNLSAFVGSVYLPCRCGEVRSVLVPSVTVCEAKSGDFA